jgi:hypothetical protein
MSIRRLARLGSVLACTLVTPASALADTSLSITGATLGPEGGSVNVSVQYACDPTSYGSINVEVVQSSGKRLVRATGNVNSTSNPDIVVCDGATRAAQISAVNFGSVPFKKGKASASAFLFTDYLYPGYLAAGPQAVQLK